MKQHFLRCAGALMAAIVLVLALTLAAVAVDDTGTAPASPSQGQTEESVPPTQETTPPPPAQLKALEIVSTGGSMEVGATKELTLMTDPNDFEISPGSVTWKVEEDEKNKGVIEVSANGVVTAKAPGDAKVTATV